MAIKPVRYVVNPKGISIPDASAAPEVGRLLCATFGFDVRVGRSSAIARGRQGDFVISTSAPIIKNFFSGPDLLTVLDHSVFGPLSSLEALTAGIPGDPGAAAEAAHVLLGLFAEAERRGVYVAVDHRHNTEPRLRFRTIFNPSRTEISVKSETLLGALHAGMHTLINFPE